jgi:hypothetical protein
MARCVTAGVAADSDVCCCACLSRCMQCASQAARDLGVRCARLGHGVRAAMQR